MANFATNGDFLIFASFGKTWQIMANFGHYVDSLAVSDSQWECSAVCNSQWQLGGSQGSLWQSVAVFGNYDNLWQSMAVSSSQLAVIANLYQPERRRREGQLRTPHDPMLAFSRIFSISRNSQTP